MNASQFSERLSGIPLIGSRVPEDFDVILNGACKVVDGDATLSDYLINEMPALVNLLMSISGTSDACADELYSFAKKTQESKTFDPNTMCSSVSDSCVKEMVKDFKAIKFVGQYIPNSIDNVIIHSCDAIKNTKDINTFMKFSLPPLVKSLSEVVGVDSICGSQFGSVNASAELKPEWICTSIGDSCRSQLINGLGSVPMLGDYIIPDTDEKPGAATLLNDVCGIVNNEKDIDEVVAMNMHTVVELVTKLITVTPTCKSSLVASADTMRDNYFSNKDTVENVKVFCNLEPACGKEIMDGVRAIEQLKDAVPKGLETLFFDGACPLLSAENPSDYIDIILQPGGILDKLPLMLGAMGSLSKLGEAGVSPDCQGRFEDVRDHPDAGLPDTWTRLIPCRVGKTCLDDLMVSFESMPVIGKPFQDATKEYTGLLDVLVSTPCQTQAPTLPPSASGGRGDPTSDDDDFVAPTGDGNTSGTMLGVGLGAATAVACAIGAAMYVRRRRSNLGAGSANPAYGGVARRASTSRFMTSKELGGSLNYNQAAPPSKPPKPEMYSNPMNPNADLKV